MFRKLKWVIVLAAFPAILGYFGCTTDDPAAPQFAGPSVLAISLEMTVNPDQLTAGGWSSSVVEVVWRNENGQRTPGRTVDFDLGARGSVGAGGGSFGDIGNLAPIWAPRPVAGGTESRAVSAVTDGDGVARVRYWAPFRTDQVNDISVTITSRPAGNDYRAAFYRQVDIYLRAADRPLFPGGSACAISVEPQKTEYAVGELIFFTATQALGASGQPIARYEWDFGDERVSTAVGRSVQHAYALGNDYTVTLFTTESVSGAVEQCTVDIRVR